VVILACSVAPGAPDPALVALWFGRLSLLVGLVAWSGALGLVRDRPGRWLRRLLTAAVLVHPLWWADPWSGDCGSLLLIASTVWVVATSVVGVPLAVAWWIPAATRAPDVP